jgi:hypothetical protein
MFLFNGLYGILYGIFTALWLGIRPVFGHFPIGYKLNTFCGRLIKEYDGPIHLKQPDPFYPAR